MRVISGQFRSRRLRAVSGRQTRPTTDKVKEAMFNMLGGYFESGNGLDLYAGSGGLGIEAVSRGLNHIVLVDHQYAAIQTIQENVAMLHDDSAFTVLKMDAQKAIQQLAQQGAQFDLVLLDPPYKQQQIEKLLGQLRDLNLLRPQAVILAETDTTVTYPQIPDFELVRQQTYGITEVSIFHFQPDEVN